MIDGLYTGKDHRPELIDDEWRRTTDGTGNHLSLQLQLALSPNTSGTPDAEMDQRSVLLRGVRGAVLHALDHDLLVLEGVLVDLDRLALIPRLPRRLDVADLTLGEAQRFDSA